MAYCFKRKEPVRKAIRRLEENCIEEVTACLKARDRGEAVHGARKGIKKGRALLRIVKPSISKSAYRRQTDSLRQAAGELGPVRDTFVVAKTLAGLHQQADGNVPGTVWQHSQTVLKKNLGAEVEKFEKKSLACGIEATLEKSAKAWHGLTLHEKGWKAISRGIKRTYRRAQCAYQTAQTQPSPENLHLWRKRSKDVWYAVRLLRETRPAQIDGTITRFKQLVDYLGDDHDLVMLEQSLSRNNAIKNSAGWAKLETLISRRHRELRSPAFRLGSQLYADSPKDFCKRLGLFWHSWRK